MYNRIKQMVKRTCFICERNDESMMNNEVDEKKVARIQAMGEKLHLVMRMAAMGMLVKNEDGFAMKVNPKVSMDMPGVKSLFGAYLCLLDRYGDDWCLLDAALDTPWTMEAIRMVKAEDPTEFVRKWKNLHDQVIEEARETLAMSASDDAQDTVERNPKLFLLLCLNIYEKMIDILMK